MFQPLRTFGKKSSFGSTRWSMIVASSFPLADVIGIDWPDETVSIR